MNDRARNWYLEEWGMVKNRWLLTYIPKLTFGYYRTLSTGNQMTIWQGIKHMIGVVQYIGEHPDYYK